jgi:starch phosphorylase
MTAEEVVAKKRSGYIAHEELRDGELAEVIELIKNGVFSPGDRHLFDPIVHDLMERDPFLVLADFRSYVDCQRRVDEHWRQPQRWVRSSILNCARAGRFSSDRSISEYAEQIWRISPVRLP